MFGQLPSIFGHYVFNMLIFFILMGCAYLLLKPIILKLIDHRCIYTLKYLVVSLLISVIVLGGIILIPQKWLPYEQRIHVLGALWLTIILVGSIIFIRFIAKSLSQHYKNKNASKINGFNL